MPNADIPFRLSMSADDADPDARLLVSAQWRRLSGMAQLTDDALVFDLDGQPGPGTGKVSVPFTSIASAVLRPGILTSRLRLTARDGTAFANVSPRNPGELTLLVSRKFRHEVRDFVSLLQIRIAEENHQQRRTPPPSAPAAE